MHNMTSTVSSLSKFRNAYICGKSIKINTEISPQKSRKWLPMWKGTGYNWKGHRSSILLLIFYVLIWVEVTSEFAL